MRDTGRLLTDGYAAHLLDRALRPAQQLQQFQLVRASKAHAQQGHHDRDSAGKHDSKEEHVEQLAVARRKDKDRSFERLA